MTDLDLNATEVRHIAVGDLTARHIGQRAVVTETAGVTVTGSIERVWATNSYGERPAKVSVLIETERGEYELKNAEMDYQIQIMPEGETHGQH